MRKLMLALFLGVIAAGGAAGASADSPPTLPPEVICGPAAKAMAAQAGIELPAAAEGAMICFYPEQSR